MKKLLLHICCAPCASSAIMGLNKAFSANLSTSFYWHNPNIWDANEYDKRKNSAALYAKNLNCDFLEDENSACHSRKSDTHSEDCLSRESDNPSEICHSCESRNPSSIPNSKNLGDKNSSTNTKTSDEVAQIWRSPNGDCIKNCLKCYEIRLLKTALYAKKNNFDCFSTSLFSSPHQQHSLIKSLCQELSKSQNIEFLYIDFRPFFYDGKNALRGQGYYFQKYCGCEASYRERLKDNPL